MAEIRESLQRFQGHRGRGSHLLFFSGIYKSQMVGGCVLLEFNKEAAPVAAAGLAVVSLLEQINRASGI